MTCCRLGTLLAVSMLYLVSLPLYAQNVLSPKKVSPRADLHGVIQHLGDSEFSARTAAQTELEKVTSWRDRDALAAELSAATDEEIRVRLLQRITDIEEGLVKDPPPISLEVKNAEIPEVAQALANALGIEVGWQRFPYPEPVAKPPFPTYTLAAKNKPLWEVFDALSKQHPLSLADRPPFGLQEVPSHHAQPGTFFGCLGAFPMATDRVLEYADFQFAIDPRIKVVKFAPPQFTLLTDDLGGVMFTDHGNPDPPWWAAASVGIGISNDGIASYSLAKPGAHEIASAKGTAHFIMQIGKETKEQSIAFELKHLPIPAPPATAPAHR